MRLELCVFLLSILFKTTEASATQNGLHIQRVFAAYLQTITRLWCVVMCCGGSFIPQNLMFWSPDVPHVAASGWDLMRRTWITSCLLCQTQAVPEIRFCKDETQNAKKSSIQTWLDIAAISPRSTMLHGLVSLIWFARFRFFASLTRPTRTIETRPPRLRKIANIRCKAVAKCSNIS